MRHICALTYLVFSLSTAVIGHKIHGSAFWAVVDFLFPIIVWLKWLICQEVTLSVIKSAFAFFFA